MSAKIIQIPENPFSDVPAGYNRWHITATKADVGLAFDVDALMGTDMADIRAFAQQHVEDHTHDSGFLVTGISTQLGRQS